MGGLQEQVILPLFFFVRIDFFGNRLNCCIQHIQDEDAVPLVGAFTGTWGTVPTSFPLRMIGLLLTNG